MQQQKKFKNHCFVQNKHKNDIFSVSKRKKIA